jgi:hypothetical protein
MPIAEGVLREVSPEGYAQLYRYTVSGEFSGDTWHETVADADHQLYFEFGGATTPWTVVPPGTSDPHAYLVSWLQHGPAETSSL